MNMRPQEQRFSFTGTGAEYFRIWIVNFFLTILTLGIYSAWAKVRRMQYFYRNTHLADSSFDYHGTAIAILKGRLIGFALFAAYYGMLKIMPLVGLGIGLLIVLIMPYMLVLSFRFRLYNTSYRGLRFGFVGSIKSAYVVFLALPLAALFTLYLMAPLAHHQIKAYQHKNSRFGQSAFSFTAQEGSFFKIYFFAFLQFLLVTSLFSAGGYFLFKGMAGSMPQKNLILAIILAVYALMIISSLLVIPYFIARIQNLIWNKTQLGESHFSSSMTARGLAWVLFSNFIFVILTLGLFKPFADIRLARYRLEHMALLLAGDMGEFIASEQQKIGAAGMETAEVFDIDIGF